MMPSTSTTWSLQLEAYNSSALYANCVLGRIIWDDIQFDFNVQCQRSATLLVRHFPLVPVAMTPNSSAIELFLASRV